MINEISVQLKKWGKNKTKSRDKGENQDRCRINVMQSKHTKIRKRLIRLKVLEKWQTADKPYWRERYDTNN